MELVYTVLTNAYSCITATITYSPKGHKESNTTEGTEHARAHGYAVVRVFCLYFCRVDWEGFEWRKGTIRCQICVQGLAGGDWNG